MSRRTYGNAVGLEGFGDRWPRGGPREKPRPEDKDLLSNYGGGGPYDEDQFMPMPSRRDFGPLPPQAYRGGQEQMIIDYLLDMGAQGGANGFLNNRLMNRLQPNGPVTDTEVMMQKGGDGSPIPRDIILRELMRR